jgi:integrase
VVYFHAYDRGGKRMHGKSTGETTMTAARVKCNRLLREGRLVRDTDTVPTFEEYSKGWWEWETCEYLKSRMKRHNLTEGYAVKCHRALKNQLVPHFGNLGLDKITVDGIEQWFDGLAKKGIKNTTINSYYSTLKTMLRWAAKKKVIQYDPTTEIEKLKNDRKDISIITREEFKALFVGDWKTVWGNDLVVCAANKLAALTGMRSSEVLGLKGEFVFDDHIFLCNQYDRYGYRPTKTKEKHNIPLVENMVADLKELMKANGKGFVFSADGGVTPISHKILIKGFYRALGKIGMEKAEIKKRGLCLHAWRHFCNTELQKAGLSIRQVQAVTGHKSQRMTDWYSHFDASEFAEVPKVQNSLLGIEEEKPKPDNAGGLHIVKQAVQQTA